MTVEVRRGADRFVTAVDGRTTRHSFSFDRHYDPTNVACGFLVCHNEDLVAPGRGYPEHPHRDLDIVTWVLDGTLRHEDTTGHAGEVTPGLVQRMTAGTGVVHTEVNGGVGLVHFVQMWVLPGEAGLPPSYEQRDVDADLRRGGWVTLASGMPSHADITAARLSNSRAGLHVARLSPGASVCLPEAETLHLFVARGCVEIERLGELDTGDAARFFGTGGQRLTVPTHAPVGAELLLWEMSPVPR